MSHASLLSHPLSRRLTLGARKSPWDGLARCCAVTLQCHWESQLLKLNWHLAEMILTLCTPHYDRKCPRLRQPSHRALVTRGTHGQGRTEKVPAQAPSPNVSWPSRLRCFEAGQGGGTRWLGKEKEGSALSSARVGFLPRSPPPSGSRPTPGELAGTLLSGRRKTFKATGRHFCQAEMTASVPASSLHSSGVKCS